MDRTSLASELTPGLSGAMQHNENLPSFHGANLGPEWLRSAVVVVLN